MEQTRTFSAERAPGRSGFELIAEIVTMPKARAKTWCLSNHLQCGQIRCSGTVRLRKKTICNREKRTTMICLRRTQFVSVLALSSMLFTAAVLPAQAGSVTIHARQTGGQSLKIPFAVTCIENNGSESQAEYYSVWTGSDLEVDGCDKFAVYFRSGGRSYDYEIRAGRSYTFEWTGNHWNLYDE